VRTYTGSSLNLPPGSSGPGAAGSPAVCDSVGCAAAGLHAGRLSVVRPRWARCASHHRGAEHALAGRRRAAGGCALAGVPLLLRFDQL